MQKIIIALIALMLLLSATVYAKQLSGTSAVFNQQSLKPFTQLQIETENTGFAERKALLEKFPTALDTRVRKADASTITLIRTLLAQTIDTKLYAKPDFKTLSCNGNTIFDKDRSIIPRLAELSCVRNIQVPYLRTGSVGKPFVTGAVARKITGRTVAGIFTTPKTDCNEALKDIAAETMQGILRSERSLVNAEIEASTCSGLSTARSSALRGDGHFSASRYASAINAYEDAWRKAVSCVCKSIG